MPQEEGGNAGGAGTSEGIEEVEESPVERLVGGVGDGAEGVEGDVHVVRKFSYDLRFHIYCKGAGSGVEGGLLGRGFQQRSGGVNIARVDGKGVGRQRGERRLGDDVTDLEVGGKGSGKSCHDKCLGIEICDKRGSARGPDADGGNRDIAHSIDAAMVVLTTKNPGEGPGFWVNGGEKEESARLHGSDCTCR